MSAGGTFVLENFAAKDVERNLLDYAFWNKEILAYFSSSNQRKKKHADRNGCSLQIEETEKLSRPTLKEPLKI